MNGTNQVMKRTKIPLNGTNQIMKRTKSQVDGNNAQNVPVFRKILHKWTLGVATIQFFPHPFLPIFVTEKKYLPNLSGPSGTRGTGESSSKMK